MRRKKEIIDPNEIFLDSSNLPDFDTYQFEGRIEQPISKFSILLIGAFFICVVFVYGWKLSVLQVARGEELRARADNNRLENSLIFATRGSIFDRNDVPLVWNVLPESEKTWEEEEVEDGKSLNPFPLRRYTENRGGGALLGYLSYPHKDASGIYYDKEYKGMAGIEKEFDAILNGKNGLKIQEVDAEFNLQSENVIEPPLPGTDIHLSVDSRISEKMYEAMADLAGRVGFQGGAGVIMDVETGEILAMTSYPEYNPTRLVAGDTEGIEAYQNDKRKPFLNRPLSGLYTPGSIMKPFVAIGALTEGIISPAKEILSTGALTLPNPYDPSKPTIFKDWRAHGWVNMRQALAVSSDVYFYEIGGGFEDQKGLGITKIEKYMRMFGFGAPTGIPLAGEAGGVIPNPEWKKQMFEGEDWLLGNTYHTAIGQYGFQITLLQAVRATAAIATDGTLVEPQVLKDVRGEKTKLDLSAEDFQVVQEGMRMAVTGGTAASLSHPGVTVAGKTGTAELGYAKDLVNSWVIGFFPYEKPRYAFAVVMERGPVKNLTGSPFVMRQVLDWMAIYSPEYLKVE